ncbi:IS1380 family transposase [Nocardioides sp.]|uniref:IS1380 family transposase n=1 Tax=Nocardioides sp. TaxID=35761 RepID=UPI00273751BB|nr:IS1380 family transposase [Nocardioides sp.]MDP3889895.1 IS1380 family transposase [Nocardioides sp.]
MKRSPVPNLILDPVRESLISSSGALLVREVVRVAGLERGLCQSLSSWRPGRARHDPGKVLLDVATAVALGGDCLADVAAVRAQPEVFGHVASDPTVSRVFAALAADADNAVAAIRQVHARARAAVWARRRPLAGTAGKRAGGQVVVDLDATLVTAHSEKEGAEPTHKKTFGFAPMCAFVDHGEHGTGETLAIELRPGKASPWNSADHIAILDAALAQLPEHERGQVLVRADTGAASKAFLHRITDLGLEYSIGFAAHDTVKAAIEAIPEQAWRAAVDGDGEARDGAQVADLTAWMPTPFRETYRSAHHKWPSGMRVIARRERPHPGAQLRLTDHNGWRITCFATNTKGPGWTLAALEVRHRQRARCEDRIRCLKDTGLRNLPFHDYAKNRIWVEVVTLAADLLAWTQTLAFDQTEPARRWEPKRLRFRILTVAGRIIRTGRRRRLRLPRDWPWNQLIDTGWHTLHTA